MIVQRCDNCKKQIKGLDSFKLGKNYSEIDLCDGCATPIVRTITEQQLLNPKPLEGLRADFPQNLEV